MDKLISNSARTEISARVKDILRSLCIDDWQSKAQYQHQNFAERRWQHFKKNLNWYMNYRNVPPEAWLLCAQWIADVMNHTAEKSLGWRIPMQGSHLRGDGGYQHPTTIPILGRGICKTLQRQQLLRNDRRQEILRDTRTLCWILMGRWARSHIQDTYR